MSKHTPGAERAAVILEDERIRNIFAREDWQTRIDKMAEIIDRETAAPELLEASKALKGVAETLLVKGRVKRGPYLKQIIWQADAAIAKAEPKS